MALLAVITGILLLPFYTATAEEAHRSVTALQASALLRAVRAAHHWASALLILLGIAYLVYGLFTSSYRRPWHLAWMAAVGMVLLFFLFQLTGHLLPWDAHAVSSTVIEAGVAENVPGIGPLQARLVRGGEAVSPRTLGTWYIVHVGAAPPRAGGPPWVVPLPVPPGGNTTGDPPGSRCRGDGAAAGRRGTPSAPRKASNPRLSYQCQVLTVPDWVMLPSAAAFVDPLFSTGFPLTLLGIHRVAEALQESWGQRSARGEFQARLCEHTERTAREAETAALLVGACYRLFADFPAFAALSMLYFVAASYSEMARCLGRPELASEFLLQNRPPFRQAFQRHCRAAWGGSPSGRDAFAADMEPFNLAGLCEPGKRNWYDVDLNDVVRGAGKLELSPEEVRAFFTRMGW